MRHGTERVVQRWQLCAEVGDVRDASNHAMPHLHVQRTPEYQAGTKHTVLLTVQ